MGAGCIAAYELDGDASDVGKTYGGIPTNIGYTGMQFAPDLVWAKYRDISHDFALIDSARGVGKVIRSNKTIVEQTFSDTITSFDSNGFTVGSDAEWFVNRSGANYVAWCWKAAGYANTFNVLENGSTTSSATAAGVGITAGSITNGWSVSANRDAGFSIVSYTGNGSTSTVGHGLSSTVELLIVKGRETTNDWAVLHKDGANGNFLQLNATYAQSGSGSVFGSPTARPTDSVFTIGNAGETGTLNKTYIAYCFHSVDGFSKIGSYVGTGATGNSIVTGFEPAFVMIKPSSLADNWLIYDNKRGNDIALFANLANADTTYAGRLELNSNGFTLDTTNSGWNGSGATYIFIAFAADPAPEPVLANSFDISLYTGNGATQNIYSSLSPDLVWIKNRNSTQSHRLYDSVRGANLQISSNQTAAESNSGGLTSFDSNGFSLDNWASVNTNNNTYVAWQWKAAEIPAINNNGSITSIVSANPAAGFSIVSWTSTATTSTIGHGLENPPSIVIMKSKSNSGDWQVYSSAIGATQKLLLNGTNAASSSGVWGNTSPNENVFTSAFNNSGNIIAYCFHSVDGYQKMGSYKGNGSTSGPTITTGFEPRFLLIKEIDNPNVWFILDSLRDTTNPRSAALIANSSVAEDNDTTNYKVNFNSDNFQIVTSYNGFNRSESNYIYLVIA